MNLPYNVKDRNSIISYAKQLKGKTLRTACKLDGSEKKFSGKGRFGQTLEQFYFLYDVNSNAEADFKEAGLELKSSPLKKLKSRKAYRSKERVVLSIIDYLTIIDEDFENSSLWKENKNILFIFYLHKQGYSILDYEIKRVDVWYFPDEDVEVIKKDWSLIQQKVLEGKAHELSEGDTYYLGACTKGSNSRQLRKQPNSSIKAKQRAFSLKQGYVNHIIASLAHEETVEYGKLISSKAQIERTTIEDIIQSKFAPYLGRSITEIADEFGLLHKKDSKHYTSLVAKAMLVGSSKEIEEFEKAEIEIKAIRIDEFTNNPKENISFPAIKYTDVFNKGLKKDFDKSDIKQQLEKKFLFVFYKIFGQELIFEKYVLWNMPYADIKRVEAVWNDLAELLKNGRIIKGITQDKSGSIRRNTYFPSIRNEVAQIRPHGRNANDTYPLPCPDKLTSETAYTKHCFWLLGSYIRDKVYLNKSI